MSLDVYLVREQPVDVYADNITHNLGPMATAVRLGEELTLYAVLWRPDECVPALTRGSELITYLGIGLNVLLDNAEYYRSFNPDNGWGTYEHLVQFTRDYLLACTENPDAVIRVSR